MNRSATRSAQNPPREMLDGPYVGLLQQDQDSNGDGINAGRRKTDRALGGPHCLLVGGTGQGKGRRVLAPNIILWGQRPVIAMSAKGDLVELTVKRRASRGPVYLLDLSGEVSEAELRGVAVQRVVSDPCALVTTDDEAKMMADLLLATSYPGKGGESDGAMWRSLASRPLAAFLRAGGDVLDDDDGSTVQGGGIDWVLQALDHPDPVATDELDGDVSEPTWGDAQYRARVLHSSRHAGSLAAVIAQDRRQRDSVAINIRAALDPWSLSTVTGDGHGLPFRPAMLEQPGATLYIVSPQDGSAAGAASAVVEQSIQHWRRNVARGLPTLGLFLDEVAQSAPLPKLPSHIAVLRGYNVRLVAAVQTVIQLKRGWDEVGMEEMLRTFPSLLLLPNTPDKEPLDLASWYAGEDERTTSNTDGFGRSTRSTDRVERVTSAELVPRKAGTGRLLISGSPGVLVDLPDISETDLQD